MIIEELEKDIEILKMKIKALEIINERLWSEISKNRSGIRPDMFILKDGKLK